MAAKRKTPPSDSPRPKGTKAKKTPPPDAPPPPQAPVESPQLTTLVTKGLDLAQAGLNLGIALVERFGSTVQDQVSGKLAQARDALAGATSAPQGAPPAGPTVGSVPPSPDPVPPEPGRSAFAGVTNRLPLFPGSPLRVPFSINNESADAPKHVQVELHDLVGEVTGAKFEPGNVKLEPASAAIAPMDFEKFVLTGLVPMSIRSDAYRGWIIVSGQEQLRIPLRLVVTAAS